MQAGFPSLKTLLFSALLISACHKPNTKDPTRETDDKPIGHQTTQLAMHYGIIWGGSYSVEVSPGKYALVENENCKEAKEQRSDLPPVGFCIVRITQAQSDQFEAAMARFKSSSRPLQDYTLEGRNKRPDGKPCRNEVTDNGYITLTWTGTEGVRVASFYTGCDSEEFKTFYEAARSVTDALPIEDIIKER